MTWIKRSLRKYLGGVELPKTIAYVRVSTDKQDLNNQKLALFDYANKNNLKMNKTK